MAPTCPFVPAATHAVLPGSPVLSRIDDCLDFDIERDQRSQRRPGAGSERCDVGTDECQATEIFADGVEP